MNQRSTEIDELPVVDAAAESLDGSRCGSPVACCAGWKAAMVVMALVTAGGIAAAGYFAGVASKARNDSVAAFPFPMPSSIDATAAVSSDKFSIATGVISEEAEGFFVLDHNSGILQCSVFYPRVGQFMATYTANVSELIGAGAKGGSYIMVTGQADLTRGGRGAAMAPTLVYVLNTTTGNYGVLSVPFDRQAAVTGRPQTGVMIPVGTGTASVIPTR